MFQITQLNKLTQFFNLKLNVKILIVFYWKILVVSHYCKILVLNGDVSSKDYILTSKTKLMDFQIINVHIMHLKKWGVHILSIHMKPEVYKHSTLNQTKLFLF